MNKNKTMLLWMGLAVLVIAAVVYGVFIAPLGGSGGALKYHKPGDFIVTNISDSSRLMKIQPILEYDDSVRSDADKEDYLKLHQPIIRECVISIVRAKTEPELRSTGIVEQLRSEIYEALRLRLDLPYLTNIYFYDFVLQ